MDTVSRFLKKHNLKVIKRFTNCHNKVYKVKDIEGKVLVLKTNFSKKRQKYLRNEIDWLKQGEKLEKVLGVRMPRIINITKVEEQNYLLLEFVKGVNYREKIDDNSFGLYELNKLAEFTNNIEGIGFVKTLRSQEKKKQDLTHWDEIFSRNASKWYKEINQKLESNAQKDLKGVLDLLFKESENFSCKKVGLGGIHGSAKMEEYIVDSSRELFVIDWEMASSVYINFYQTASIASYLSIRLKDADFAKDFLKLRRKSLRDKQRSIFEKNFNSILSQRMLGDIWDVFFIEKTVRDRSLSLRKIKSVLD